jgi:hypothetical protein
MRRDKGFAFDINFTVANIYYFISTGRFGTWTKKKKKIYQTFSFEIWMEERKAYTKIFI